jgi:hypothetical protein
LVALDSAAREASATAELQPMRAAVQRGVSANLCEAILGLNEGGGKSGVEFAFSWAPSRGAPTGAPDAVKLLPEVMPILEETVRVFRETATVESTEIVGLVQKLEHMGEAGGRVTIFGDVDGSSKSVVLELPQQDHALAIPAYEQRLKVTCRGELTRVGKSWTLLNPRDFAVLDEGDTVS